MKNQTVIPFSGLRRALSSLAIGGCLLLGQALGQAQVAKVGDAAEDFEITNRETGEPLRLSDYEGHVVVLDFFAWWCGPCRTSSPDIEKNVYQYFNERDGNKYGVPVTVIAVNTESDNPDRTDQFVEDAGLKLFADDLKGVAWAQFNETGYIPLFVIINGVAGNSDYKQWEVIYKHTGYEGSTAFRRVINKVKLAHPTPQTSKPNKRIFIIAAPTVAKQRPCQNSFEISSLKLMRKCPHGRGSGA